MIDMFNDLPTEAELGQAILESRKKESKNPDPFDNNTFFEFWTPVTKHRDNVVSDKTGTVKPKCDFIKTEVRMDDAWEEFLKNERAKDKKTTKPVTDNDTFGSVVLTSYAQDPDPKKLVGSIKALKKTTVKEMSGKVKTTVEELGTNTVVTKGMAASPKKDGLVGIVKNKNGESMKGSNFSGKKVFDVSKKPDQEAPVETKVYDSYDATIKPSGKKFAEYSTKDSLPGFKKGSSEFSSKVGTVKKKELSAAGSKVFKNIDGFKK